jgi:zinc transport system substrate-binding protein
MNSQHRPLVVFKRPTCAAALVLVALLVWAGCGPERPRQDGGKPVVTASIFPLADAARQVGGGRIRVVTLLPPGTTPHGFDPEPAQAEQLAHSRLLLMVGLGMDSWAERCAEASGADIRIVRFARAVEEQAPETGDEHGPSDPHLWLDPVLMKGFVPVLVDELVRLDPAGAAGYRRRGKTFEAELAKLDREYRDALDGLKGKAFLSFHPAFTHLAARYGLEQATLTSSHAQEGGPASLEHAVEFVKEHKLKAVFAEPQFPADKLQWLTEQTGASVERLDPLGNPNVEGYASYLAMMRSNLKALVAALSD